MKQKRSSKITLDDHYSTTRLLTQEKPIIENKLEDKFESFLFLPEGENRQGEGGLRTQGYFKKSYADKPLISIITVVYNGEESLEETIESVINQSYDNVEYIIIDGGSTDGTVDIIKKYEDKIDYWVSESDKGIADAFNKGINASSGEFLYFLNCGDILYSNDSLLEVIQNIKIKFCDMLVYKIAMVDEDRNILQVAGKHIGLKKQKYRNYLPHQGMIIKKELFKKFGEYDMEYKLGMDYEWSTRLINAEKNLKIFFFDDVLCKMLEGGVSQTNYIGTFLAYHKARIKNKIINRRLSYLISLFFIIKRTFGILVRQLAR